MKRTFKFSFALISILLSSVAWGQTGQTATDYIANRVTFKLLDAPQKTPNGSVSVSGNPGPATYYYWIITNSLAGSSSPAGPFQVLNAPNTLSGSNFNIVSWSGVAAAVNYDVLRTSAPIPPFGACNCAVVTGTSSVSTNDQSNTLNAYTVNPLDPGTVQMTETNESLGAGISALTWRAAGATIGSVTSAGSWKIPSVSVTGTTTLANIDNRILMDGVKYAANGGGLAQAITDAQASGSRDVTLPCGTININATINVTHGGYKFTGCGAGLTDAGSSPATILQWTGAAGQDMFNIQGGAAPNRIDVVIFQNVLLDGAGTARYVMRSEKVDDAILDNVRIRNGATAGFYTVDATGWKFRSVQFSQCPSYCAVFDWGTGGFDWTGGNVDILVANSNPAILVQGAVNAWHARGLELDASGTGAFAGYFQVTGFDANSSFASAPAGGSGAPQSFAISDSSVFHHVGANAPSQGADFLITGTAANHAQKGIIERVQFNGLSISPAAVKIDLADNILLSNVQSSGHTASTMIHTGNGSFEGMWMVLSTDTTRVSGAGAGLQLDLTQGPAGQLANSSSYSSSTFYKASEGSTSGAGAGTATFFDDSAAHRWKMTNNGAAAVQVVGSGVDINTSDQVSSTHLSAALPVNQGGTGVTAAQGNGTKVQLSTGATSTNHCVSYDVNGNAVDSGATCPSSGTVAQTSAANVYFVGCNGTATAGSTITMPWPGNATVACTNTVTTLQLPVGSAGTAKNLRVRCATGGVNASSGVFTLQQNGGATALTCTTGTGGTCTDTTHSVTLAAADALLIQFTTQAAETLANCMATFEKQ